MDADKEGLVYQAMHDGAFVPEDRPCLGWPQLAGYFDGDGSITIRKTSRGRPFTLDPALEFGDQSKRQIGMVREFLRSRGIKVGRMSLRGAHWRIEVGTMEGATQTLREMLPFLYKKRNEAKATLDYLSDNMTANELQEILRAAVRRGDRERVGPFVDILWARSEGAKKAWEYSALFLGRKPSLGLEDEREINRQDKAGESQRAIAKSIGLARGVVRRTIYRHKREGRHSTARATS
jgi:hypothetical protein